MAKVLRWRVLANRRFTVRQADLVLGGESLTKLLTLMKESRKSPLTLLVCACWVGHSSPFPTGTNLLCLVAIS